MKTKIIKVALSILVIAIIAVLIFSDISNKFLIIAALFIGYTIVARAIFPGKSQKEYSRKFTRIYSIAIVFLVSLLFLSGILMEFVEDKSTAYTVFMIILYCNLAGYSIPIFYRAFKKPDEANS